MAENTPVSRLMLGNTTEELASMVGKERQIVIDTVKKTAVVMDGETPGGHPLAKERRKIIAGTPNVQINGAAEADLSADIVVKVLPGTVPTKMELVKDPSPDEQGLFLVISYMDAQGVSQTYAIDMNALAEDYEAGANIKIEDHVISSPTWGRHVDEFPADPSALDVPVGGFVTSPATLGGVSLDSYNHRLSDLEEAVGNRGYNSQATITESGEWVSPFTGWAKIVCVGGGNGALSRNRGCSGGNSGGLKIGFAYLLKDTSYTATIGAGGIGNAGASAFYDPTMDGGETSFSGLIDFMVFPGITTTIIDLPASSTSLGLSRCYGAGRGGGTVGFIDGEYIAYDGQAVGAGGGAFLYSASGSATKYGAGNGASGAVFIYWNDPSKGGGE